MNLIVNIFMFFFSFNKVTHELPEAHRKFAFWSGMVLMMLTTVGAGLIGAFVGWKFGPDPGGPFVGAIGFATAGFFTGMSWVLFRMLNVKLHNDSSSTKSKMSLFTAIAIPLLGWMGLTVGVIIGWNMMDKSDGAMMPMMLALLGSLLGAVLGAIYEKVFQGN